MKSAAVPKNSIDESAWPDGKLKLSGSGIRASSASGRDRSTRRLMIAPVPEPSAIVAASKSASPRRPTSSSQIAPEIVSTVIGHGLPMKVRMRASTSIAGTERSRSAADARTSSAWKAGENRTAIVSARKAASAAMATTTDLRATRARG